MPVTLVVYLDHLIQHVLEAPQRWGSLEAAELRVFTLLEIQDAVVFPLSSGDPQRMLSRWRKALGQVGNGEPLHVQFPSQEDFTKALKALVQQMSG